MGFPETIETLLTTLTSQGWYLANAFQYQPNQLAFGCWEVTFQRLFYPDGAICADGRISDVINAGGESFEQALAEALALTADRPPAPARLPTLAELIFSPGRVESFTRRF
jgi:hypothetical protein